VNTTLLAFAEGRHESCSDGSPKSLIVSRSTDAGSTWSEPEILVGDGKIIIGNPMPLVTSSGDVLVQYITASGSAVGDAVSLQHVYARA
jgi:sialidase-1